MIPNNDDVQKAIQKAARMVMCIRLQSTRKEHPIFDTFDRNWVIYLACEDLKSQGFHPASVNKIERDAVIEIDYKEFRRICEERVKP